MSPTNKTKIEPKNVIQNTKINYKLKVKSYLFKKFLYSNVHEIPALKKIVVNMGIGKASNNSKYLSLAEICLSKITGQKPRINRARKSISQFKLREKMPIGISVTLRKHRMWNFYDRLIILALPRVRDFRGLDKKKFDGHGNYNFGLSDQYMFHEIDQTNLENRFGMNISLITTAKNNNEGFALLEALKFPFKKFNY